jgi:hypothetical protein
MFTVTIVALVAAFIGYAIGRASAPIATPVTPTEVKERVVEAPKAAAPVAKPTPTLNIVVSRKPAAAKKAVKATKKSTK